ncbi:hypothetical protein EWM62_00855 [Mucilaginibacter terrigena]|uniref:Outer membrane protein beta-barrel domain-containing protein n=1 Tax=Mucilaginibacter terrigena TaxID=2492395 RepID=A0A4Q5LR91_9SPHI|nr:hypothetical protein [Mucilaginibacter terrigena]RYU92021.1 hypothetical protein EWM62_00855 [Mucilaginibacter terrigena]
MKRMTKLVAAGFAAAAIFLGTNVANAQSTPKSALRFGIGIEGLAPTGNLHDRSNFGLGGTARLQYGVSDAVALTLTSGYYNFFGREVPTTGVNYTNLGVVPIKAGLKAFVSQNIYLGAEVGAGIEVTSTKQTKLIASPGIGWANQSWDIGARYENFSGQSYNYGTVGLRIAYGFGL